VHLAVLRTLLGALEAVCQPAFVYLSSMWYKREEQAATVSYWYMMNGAQQIVGGLLAYCFTLIDPPPGSPPRALHSWQAIFIAYGVFSVFWGIVVLVWMPDSPMRAKCFSEEDKKLLVERVRSNQVRSSILILFSKFLNLHSQTGVQNKEFRKEQFIEALKDPQMYCYMLIAFCTTLPTSGLGGFANIIIKENFKFTTLQTQLLAMVLGAYIIIVLLSSMWLVNRYKQNLIVMLVYIIPSIVGTVVLLVVKKTGKASQVGLLLSYYIVLSFWAAQTLGMSMISRNIAGQTKKTVVVAANFIAWSVGNSIGPQVFRSNDAPRYRIAFATHMGCYALLVFVVMYLRFHLRKENSRKDRLQAEFAQQAQVEVSDEGLTHAFDDLTDRENINFRYVF